MAIRWTEGEHQEYIKAKPPKNKTSERASGEDTLKPTKSKSVPNSIPNKAKKTQETDLVTSLKALGLETKIKESLQKKSTKTPKKNDGMAEPEIKVKKKKQGVSTAPIFKSIEDCVPKAVWGEDWLAVDLPGARVLTYNEMFSILQYRKYEAFRYKKICKNLIYRAIRLGRISAKQDAPFFSGPTKITLLRIGVKEMDRDALPVVFKYFIDAFKKEPTKDTDKAKAKLKKAGKENQEEACSIIDDDNPNIIVEIESLQEKGEPRLAILLEKVPDWSKTGVPSWEDWIFAKNKKSDPKAKKTKTKK